MPANDSEAVVSTINRVHFGIHRVMFCGILTPALRRIRRYDATGENGPIVVYRHPALRLFVHADRKGVHFSWHDDTRDLLPALIWAVRQYLAIAVTGRPLPLSGVESSAERE